MTEQDPGPGQPQRWAQPQQWVQPRFVETPPLEYHQLLRGNLRYRWWKPLLALGAGAVYYLVLSTVFGMAVIIPYLVLGDTGIESGFVDADAIMRLATPDTQNPVSMLLTLGSVALMLPAALLAMLTVGFHPAKRLWSVALRIRWRWILRSILPAIVALVIMDGVSVLLGLAVPDPTAGAGRMPDLDMTAALWSGVLILLLVPVQSTAEELVYRGMFMQTLGAWLGGAGGASGFARFVRGPWIPIVLPAIVFGFSHIYDIWGWLAVVLMALAAGWLSWRTGGLEAAISLHVVNNLVAFGFMTMGAGGQTGQTSDGGGPSAAIGAAIGLTLYAWWMDRDFRRRDGMRTRIDLVQAPWGTAPAGAIPASPAAGGPGA